jgi:hypothetical protein
MPAVIGGDVAPAARRWEDWSVRRGRKPFLITDAAEDPERELRRREIRYVAMMLIRALCLIAGAIIITNKPPLWPVWLVLAVIGMVLIPWLAVILANDRPAKTKAERAAARRAAPPDRLAVPAPRHDGVIDQQ